MVYWSVNGKSQRKLFLLVVCILLSLGLLASCDNDDGSEPDGSVDTDTNSDWDGDTHADDTEFDDIIENDTDSDWDSGTDADGDAEWPPQGGLRPFWRQKPGLGPYLEGGQGLIAIPDYLLGSDFPYHKRSTDREAPFAEHMTIVRLLGGYSDKDRDLVYRDSNGNLAYRWDILSQRLQPYIDAGYASEMTLVLDDIPWCFPATPVAGSFGQVAAPANPEEWGDFIEELARELVNILGFEAANSLRFRVGTEANGMRRFHGSQAEYFEHYDHAAAAIREVLPGARVGPFNVSGPAISNIDNVHNVSVFDLAIHATTEINARTGSIGTPFDFLAFSRYIPAGVDLDAHMNGPLQICKELSVRAPELKGIPCEVHEFGIQPWLGNQDFLSSEPGAWGAAHILYELIRYRQNKFAAVYHWGICNRFRDHNNVLKYFFTGQAWLYSILDHMVGGEPFFAEGTSSSVSDVQYIGIGSKLADRTIFLFSAYPKDSNGTAADQIRFELPLDAWAGRKKLQWVILDRTTSPHRMFREALLAQGLLNKEFVDRPDRLGSVRQMTTRAGEAFLGQNWETYTNAWQQSLTLVAPPSSAKLQLDTSGTIAILTLQIASPAVIAITTIRHPG